MASLPGAGLQLISGALVSTPLDISTLTATPEDGEVILPLYKLTPWRALSLYIECIDCVGGDGSTLIRYHGAKLRHEPAVDLDNTVGCWSYKTTVNAASGVAYSGAQAIIGGSNPSDTMEMYRPGVNGAIDGKSGDQLLPAQYLVLHFTKTAGASYTSGSIVVNVYTQER